MLYVFSDFMFYSLLLNNNKKNYTRLGLGGAIQFAFSPTAFTLRCTPNDFRSLCHLSTTHTSVLLRSQTFVFHLQHIMTQSSSPSTNRLLCTIDTQSTTFASPLYFSMHGTRATVIMWMRIARMNASLCVVVIFGIITKFPMTFSPQ